MANPNPDTSGLKPGGAIKHAFYVDGFLPCKNCPVLNGCPNVNQFKDQHGMFRCKE